MTLRRINAISAWGVKYNVILRFKHFCLVVEGLYVTKHCCFCHDMIGERSEFYMCQIQGMKNLDWVNKGVPRILLGERGAIAYICDGCRHYSNYTPMLNNLIQGNWSRHSKREDTT